MTSELQALELQEVHSKPARSLFRPNDLLARIGIKSSRSRTSTHDIDKVDVPVSSTDQTADEDGLPSPTTASPVLEERWNASKGNVFRTLVAFWSFLVMGMNDAAIGVLIPYFQEYYNLTYAVVSLVFLSPFIGYVLSAMSIHWVHTKVGRRGIAIIAPICHIACFLAASLHPPFAVVVVFYSIAGTGTGLIDGAWNAWIGNMANANQVLGLLHGFYGLGATIGPLVATSMITKAHWPWYYYYYFMLGIAVAELVLSALAFWQETGAKYRAQQSRTEKDVGTLKEALSRLPAARVTWLCSFFLMGYVGVEVALGGWITTFMLEVRHSSAFASGMSATGFWLGMTCGRVILGFVTPKIGESLAILIYIVICMGLELLFWLVPQFYVSTVAVAFQGFFLGPMFPAAVVAATKLLPRHLHVSSIGFAAAFGGGGAALFPFAVGAIAQAKGVKVLQPIVLAMLGVIWLLWFALPSMRRKRE